MRRATPVGSVGRRSHASVHRGRASAHAHGMRQCRSSAPEVFSFFARNGMLTARLLRRTCRSKKKTPPNRKLRENPADAAAEPAAKPMAPALDRYDIAILRELQHDARLSNAELASRIGLSAAPTWRRVQVARAAGLHHRLPRRDRPPQDRPRRARLRARRRRAQHRRGDARARGRDPRAARGDRLPLHQRRRHLRAAGDVHRPRRLLALLASRRCSSCRT